MSTPESLRPHSFRHESVVAQIIYVDDKGEPIGRLSESMIFVKVDKLWYSENSIKLGAIGLRDDQLKLKDYEGEK